MLIISPLLKPNFSLILSIGNSILGTKPKYEERYIKLSGIFSKSGVFTSEILKTPVVSLFNG